MATTYATLPLTDNFTGSSLGASWSTSTTNAAGVITPVDLSGGWPKFGTTTDASSTATGGNGLGFYNTSNLATANQMSAKLAVNLATLQGITIKFSLIDWGSGYDLDSVKVYLSTNGGTSYGSTYTLINTNQLPYTDGVWNNVSVDISAIATANSLTPSATSMIKIVVNLKGSGDPTSPKNGASANQFMYMDNFKANYTSILPVQLLSFNGEKEKEGNFLSWSTASEINNDRFELERSYDGTSFESIYSVSGKGSQYAGANYAFYDDHFSKGVIYYRLKQVDNDGATSYSKIISLQDKQNISITKFSENALSVSGDNLNSLELYDLNGKLIGVHLLNKQASTQTVSFDYSILSESVYLVRALGANDIMMTQKIVF